MTLVSKLSLVALIAAAVPTASHAQGWERGPAVNPGDRNVPAPGAVDRDRDGRDDRWERDHRSTENELRFRRDLPRWNQLRALREEFRTLDAERDRFYASGRHRPRDVRRFERWYTFRRAELDRRWDALQEVAWR